MITQFKGEYSFLSNFFKHPVFYKGNCYATAEHAFQSAKATSMNDHDLVGYAPTAAEAKKLGRKIKLCQSWEESKDIVMLQVIQCKFREHWIRKKLLDTGEEELQEGNTWGDKEWGVCLKTGEGKNKLGKILMQVRNEIRKKGK